MKPFDRISAFCGDEDGAVTVDWVVLTSAIVGLSIAVMATVTASTGQMTKAIADHLESGTTATAFP